VDYARLIVIFTSIIYEALPFVVLGVVLAGLLEEFVPQQLISRFIPQRKAYVGLAIAAGGVLGLIFPMCECGIIPVMRRLLRKGIPLSVCVCYMLAGPIINVVVITSTATAFSGQPPIPISEDREIPLGIAFAALRVGLGFIVAFNTSVVVEWQWRRHGTALLAPLLVKDTRSAARPKDDDGGPARRTWGQSLSNVSETALHDFIDIMAFLVLGAFIAAVARPIISNPDLGIENVIKGSPVLAILLMMGFAIAFCLCSEADAFVAANFQPIELWPLASKLAFLVLGPMLDFKLYLMFTRVYRHRLIFTIISCVVVQVFVYSVVVNWVDETWLRPLQQQTSSLSR
jgi:uncharacterized membrane protein YraQ (UPF0718 family)